MALACQYNILPAHLLIARFKINEIVKDRTLRYGLARNCVELVEKNKSKYY